jgi:hypothetical protein
MNMILLMLTEHLEQTSWNANQLVKKFPEHYVKGMFITVFTRNR